MEQYFLINWALTLLSSLHSLPLFGFLHFSCRDITILHHSNGGNCNYTYCDIGVGLRGPGCGWRGGQCLVLLLVYWLTCHVWPSLPPSLPAVMFTNSPLHNYKHITITTLASEEKFSYLDLASKSELATEGSVIEVTSVVLNNCCVCKFTLLSVRLRQDEFILIKTV